MSIEPLTGTSTRAPDPARTRTKTDRVHHPHGRFSSRRVAMNSCLNLAGQAAPLMAAYFAIPLLTRGIGAERFGVLTLGWLIVGYFGLFDLGLGRAVTQALAERIGTERESELPRIMCTALLLMLAFGVLGALIGSIASVPLIHHVLRVPAVLESETLRSFVVFTSTVPLVVITAGLRGVLEAKQRFDLVSSLRAPLGIAMYVAPLFALPFTHDLVTIAFLLLAVRALAFVAHLLLVSRLVPFTRADLGFHAEYVRPLLRLGGWMTVTNVVGPVLVSLDRFLIGAVVSVAAVAYYAAPYEAITKAWLFPAALTGVLFPAFAAESLAGSGAALVLYERAVKIVLLALLPIAVTVVAFAHEGLLFWLGPVFAERSTMPLQLLAIGVLFNSLAMVPFALIQGRARPDLTAKTHLVELPVYVLVLWEATRHFGVIGAAFAWSLRCIMDSAVLFTLAQRFMPAPRQQVYRFVSYLFSLLVALAGLIEFAAGHDLRLKAAAAAAVLAVSVCALWFLVLSSSERQFVFSLVRRALAGRGRNSPSELSTGPS